MFAYPKLAINSLQEIATVAHEEHDSITSPGLEPALLTCLPLDAHNERDVSVNGVVR
jgi:hypothetical protein